MNKRQRYESKENKYQNGERKGVELGGAVCQDDADQKTKNVARAEKIFDS